MKKLIVVLSILLIFGALNPEVGNRRVSAFQPPPPAFSLDLSFPDNAPPLGRVGKLLCKISFVIPLLVDENGDVTVKFILPDGFKLISGTAAWTGQIPSEGKTLEIMVQSVQVGDWEVEATASGHFKNRGIGCAIFDLGAWGRNNIYVLISEDSAVWSEKEFFPKYNIERWYPSPKDISPLDMDLSVPPSQPINSEADITFRIKPKDNSPLPYSTNVKIYFSESIKYKLVKGSPTRWSGDIPQKGLELKWTVKPLLSGYLPVSIDVECISTIIPIIIDGKQYYIRPKRILLTQEDYLNIQYVK
jgi:hypothetical protein